MPNDKQNTFSHAQRIVTCEDHVKQFYTLGTEFFLPANSVFIQAGDKLDCCYLIKSGMAVGCEFYPNGMVREGLIMFPNSFIGESFLLLDEASPISFKTIFDSTLIRINRNTFLQALQKDAQLNQLILKSLAKKFLSSMDEVRQMSTCNVTWRICNLLRIFAVHHGIEINGKLKINIRLSQQIISQLLCVNRITTVRIMKTLKELHLIEQIDGYYYITNLQALIAYQEKNSH